MENTENPQDELYRQAAATYGPALGRLARAWEADADARQDLLQHMREIFEDDDGNRCSLRTWVYRVAQNAATSHVLRRRKGNARALVSIDELAESGDQLNLSYGPEAQYGVEQAQILDRLYTLIQSLNPMDRQVILLYLEGVDAASIGEVTGISASYVSTKIHRIKTFLARRF